MTDLSGFGKAANNCDGWNPRNAAERSEVGREAVGLGGCVARGNPREQKKQREPSLLAFSTGQPKGIVLVFVLVAHAQPRPLFGQAKTAFHAIESRAKHTSRATA